MATLLCFVYFIVLTVIGFYLVYKPYGVISAPFDRSLKMRCKGTELLLIFIFATGLIGLMPVLAIRLAVLEVLCIIGIYKSHSSPVFSFPIILFFIFLLWEIWGLSYTPSVEFGFRMILKYIYPLLLALFASSVVRDKEIVLKSLLSARWVAIFTILIYFVPILLPLFTGVFWHQAALGTHYITMSIISLTLYFYSNKTVKNLIFFVLFSLPCFIWVFRTDIMGLFVALSAFALIKYRLKAIPVLLLLGVLSVASLFYIPSIKAKMYHNPDEVSLNDFLTGNVDENNINTSGRGPMWEDCKRWFYEGHELIGSGTGRVQKYMYTEATGFRRGGQLHNDLLVLMCDNGIIGLSLYVMSVLGAFVHCIYIYHKRSCYSRVLRICVIVAGSSLLGIVATMYSDNTLSYSMATLSYPWGLYGMALGLKKKEDYE